MQRLYLVLGLALFPLGCATWDTGTILPQDLPAELQARAPQNVDLLQLAALGPPVEPEQRIQSGDVLEVTVSDLANENASYPIPVRVQNDGTIRLPLVGSVPVATLTLQEAEEAVFASYTTLGYLRKPQVLISLRDSRKVRVYVLGAVSKPGQVELKGTESDLLTALVAAGGLTREAGSQIQVYRRLVAQTPTWPRYGPGTPLSQLRERGSETSPVVLPALAVSRRSYIVPEPPTAPGFSGDEQIILPPLTPHRDLPPVVANSTQAVKRDRVAEAMASNAIGIAAYQPEHPGAAPSASPRIMQIDLASAGDKRTLAQGITLEPGDTVIVEQKKLRGIYVIGMVTKPGEINVPPDRRVHVLEAVGMAGGVDRSSLPNKAVVIRAKPEDSGLVAVRIDLDRAKRDMSSNLLLMPGDTVSVEETPMSYVRGLLRGALRIGLGLDVAPALSLY
jgi:polysaccharide export outer membrane protein